MDKTKSIKSSLFQKLKNIKNFEIIIAVIFVCIIVIIYISSTSTGKTNEQTTSLTSEEYATMLEDKMSKVLSNINGAGRVNVMVMLECGIEYIYATTVEETTNSSGANTKTTKIDEIVLVSSQGKTSPVILKQNLPKISGVIITAQGAGNVSVKLELMKAVQALFDLPSENVEILIGK